MAVGSKLTRVKTMKRQIQVRTSASTFDKKYIEHTPVYDLAAYYQRKRQHQRKQLLKNFIDGITFICMSAITFSMLFLGE